jgi:hypothetical protein
MEDLKRTIEANLPIFHLIEEKDLYQLVSAHGETVLHWLAITSGYNNLSALEYILSKKLIHVNLENYRGTTPLYYAVLSKNIEAVKLFLQYGANPRIRSGFSSKFPSEVANDEIRTILLEFENNYIPISRELKLIPKFSHTTAYKYRKYMYILSNLNYFYHGKHSIVSGIELDIGAEETYKNEGLTGVADYCDVLWEDFINSIKNSKKQCLNCENEENLKRCSKCKAVYFCNAECQEDAHLIHKYDC